MLNEDVLKEFVFDCKMRGLSERTIKSCPNNNLAMNIYSLFVYLLGYDGLKCDIMEIILK